MENEMVEFKLRVDGQETFVDEGIFVHEDQISEIVLCKEMTKSGKTAEFCRLFIKNSERSYELDYPHDFMINAMREANLIKSKGN